ncbi:MAG: citrate synthase [Oscillospiraceae bacterium]|nr:citrate synthase [Oscillospiraceae bacterium]
MSSIISPVSNDAISFLCDELVKHNRIKSEDFTRYDVKRGLRNADGTGVMAGLTHICSVDGYYISDGERVPRDGKLTYRGIDINDIVNNCEKENRFGFEETAWLLMFGDLPTQKQLDMFCGMLSDARELPEDFIEDMIMKSPSINVMNKLSRSVLSLYSYDPDPENTSIENVLRQSVQLLAQMPMIMAYAYQVKRRHYYHKSMYIHPVKPEYLTAQTVLRTIRSHKEFSDEEAKLLDLALILHAEHGGGNNSAFATRVLTSSLTDTYAAIAAGIGSLKGPRHGGANLKVREMMDFIRRDVEDVTSEDQVAEYLCKILKKEAGDRSGLIYGMGHAVYTLSDPRAVILKRNAKAFAEKNDYMEQFNLIDMVERLTPEVFEKVKGSKKKVCANVDLYSGLIYDMLHIPEDLFTPLFCVARMAGWSAHRMEELMTGGRIIRPAYKSVSLPKRYYPIGDRMEGYTADLDYIPKEERS